VNHGLKYSIYFFSQGRFSAFLTGVLVKILPEVDFIYQFIPNLIDSLRGIAENHHK
jgi:hypothetical protein